MAIMIPSVISPEVKSSAERRVFKWFQNSPQTDNWIVLHSLGISTHNKVIYGEIDFFILVPRMGLFALEVKGGRVRRENGIWLFTNKYGETNSKVRGPFDQAKDGVFSIVSALKKRLNSDHRYLSNVFFGFGVMFPDIEYEAAGIDEEQWQVFDSRDANHVKSFIERLADGARRKWESVYGNFDESRLPTAEDVRYLASLLRGDFDYAISMIAQLRTADEALVTLTKEQYRCLDQLDDNPRCLIHGPAGTGKTLLAVEEVKKSAAKGEQTALFCFNSNLAEWLKSYFDDMPETLRPKYVGTLHKFMIQTVKERGVSLQTPQGKVGVQEFYQKDLPRATLKALCKAEEHFDKIVIDEAQDLICVDYLSVINACLRKGIVRGHWTMFGDFSMQAIYANGQSGAKMKELLEDYTSFSRFRLTLNCRNTKPICEEIQTVTGFEAPTGLWTKVDGPPVDYITYTSSEDQRDKLADLLNQLTDMSIEPGRITILSPHRRENSVVSLLNRFDIRDFSIKENNSITFCTIQAYKGLENTVVILTDIEDFSMDKLMYVGLSRARSGLYIMQSKPASKEYLTLLQRRLFRE
ncbi:MAG: DUF2075 domain-containing protein [Firmicutes bacterium]|nr:DUF2075 domain-containing protein [Bacillota bacterium]